MEQAQWSHEKVRCWRFHAPGTRGTVYMTGATEEEAIALLARIRGAIVFADQTLFEGKGGWILEDKLSGHLTIITHGKPM